MMDPDASDPDESVSQDVVLAGAAQASPVMLVCVNEQVYFYYYFNPLLF